MEDIHVLLVDDEKEFVEPLALRLEKRGFQAVASFDGDEAMAKLREGDFDVVVLDVVMPGKDGIQTLREMKSSKPLTEVIMLSGHASLEIAIEGMQHGAFDFLIKPPDMGELVDTLRELGVAENAPVGPHHLSLLVEDHGVGDQSRLVAPGFEYLSARFLVRAQDRVVDLQGAFDILQLARVIQPQADDL